MGDEKFWEKLEGGRQSGKSYKLFLHRHKDFSITDCHKKMYNLQLENKKLKKALKSMSEAYDVGQRSGYNGAIEVCRRALKVDEDE